MENDRPDMRRFYWFDSRGFCCHGCYIVGYTEADDGGEREDDVFYSYGHLGGFPRHPTLVWIDEPPDWAKETP